MRFPASLACRLAAALALACAASAALLAKPAADLQIGHRGRVAVRHGRGRERAPRAGPHDGGLRGLRQRQAAAHRLFRERRSAHHRRRDARHEREHDRLDFADEGRRRAVLPPAAARRPARGSAPSTTGSRSAPTSRNDRDALISDVRELGFGNSTRLWDAVAMCLDELKGIEGRRVVAGLHRWRRHGKQSPFRHRDGSGAGRRGDGVRHRLREQLLQRPAHGAQRARQRAAEDRRRDGRRLLPAQENRRALRRRSRASRRSSTRSTSWGSRPRSSTAACTSWRCASGSPE